jgi:hypothetical protein
LRKAKLAFMSDRESAAIIGSSNASGCCGRKVVYRLRFLEYRIELTFSGFVIRKRKRINRHSPDSRLAEHDFLPLCDP